MARKEDRCQSGKTFSEYTLFKFCENLMQNLMQLDRVKMEDWQASFNFSKTKNSNFLYFLSLETLAPLCSLLGIYIRWAKLKVNYGDWQRAVEFQQGTPDSISSNKKLRRFWTKFEISEGNKIMKISCITFSYHLDIYLYKQIWLNLWPVVFSCLWFYARNGHFPVKGRFSLYFVIPPSSMCFSNKK